MHRGPLLGRSWRRPGREGVLARRCGRRVLAFGCKEEDEKKAGGLGLAATRFIFSPGRGELSNSTGLRAGSVPGFIMLPYPILIRIRIR